MAIVTDCEEYNKQALLELDSLAETSALPPELVLAVPFPDVVHFGKSVYTLFFYKNIQAEICPKIENKLRTITRLKF